MPFALTGPPTAAQLNRRGMLDTSVDVAEPVAISAQADGASKQPSQAMDRSRSPRAPLSDEARLLQRLAEPELPPEATDAERAEARADAAAGVEHVVFELGGHWAEAYQELHPDWQPPPTDIEISNQRAAELTAARAAIAAAVAELDAGVSEAHEAMDDPARDSSALRRANHRMAEAYTILSTQQPPTDIAPAGQSEKATAAAFKDK